MKAFPLISNLLKAILCLVSFVLFSACNKSTRSDSVTSVSGIDSISNIDAKFFADLKDTTYDLSKVYLENGESITSFLTRTDPEFLKKYSSRILKPLASSPSGQLNLFKSKMAGFAKYLIGSPEHVYAATGVDSPAQTKLAYIPGGKQYKKRQSATIGDCKKLYLYGLDCSGMLYCMATGSGLPITVRQDIFDVTNASQINKWNEAFDLSSDYKDLQMVKVDVRSANEIKFGDMIVWPNAHHMAFYMPQGVYMSNGSFKAPGCEQNQFKGPTSKAMSQGLIDAFGKSYFVLRVKAKEEGDLEIEVKDGRSWTQNNTLLSPSGGAIISLFETVNDVINNTPSYQAIADNFGKAKISVATGLTYYLLIQNGTLKNVFNSYLVTGILLGSPIFADLNGDGKIDGSDKAVGDVITPMKDQTVSKKIVLF